MDYVNGLDVPGYKYISYVYTTLDVNNQYDIHFGLVNKEEEYDPEDPEGDSGDLTCTAPIGMYHPVTTAIPQMTTMLNSYSCNPYLRMRGRPGSFSIPPDPRELGQITPCTDMVLAYAGSVLNSTVDYVSNDWFYVGNLRRPFWWEDLPVTSSMFQATQFNQDQLHIYASSVGIHSIEYNIFTWVNNFYDPVGYSGIVPSNIVWDQNTVRHYHKANYTWQQLRWIAIPDPDCWALTISTAGVTPELNP